MTGICAETPREFIRGILSFEKRKNWESMFEDGVVVEGINLNEISPFLTDCDNTDFEFSQPEVQNNADFDPLGGMSFNTSSNNTVFSPSSSKNKLNLARATDDVNFFLETVDLAGVPEDMPIAYLNDPERQHALAHLRKVIIYINYLLYFNIIFNNNNNNNK